MQLQERNSPAAGNNGAANRNPKALGPSCIEHNAAAQKNPARKRGSRSKFDAARYRDIRDLCIKLKRTDQPAPCPEFKRLPSLNRLGELFRYDPVAGKLYCNKARGGLAEGKEAGTLCNGYVQVFADYQAYRAHRIAWKMH